MECIERVNMENRGIKRIENTKYGVENLSIIIKSILIIIVTIKLAVGMKLTFWKVATSPLKIYDMLKKIWEQYEIIKDIYNIAWEEIKDIEVNEIDDLLKNMLKGFDEVFGAALDN
jgi:hypothetical protein